MDFLVATTEVPSSLISLSYWLPVVDTTYPIRPLLCLISHPHQRKSKRKHENYQSLDRKGHPGGGGVGRVGLSQKEAGLWRQAFREQGSDAAGRLWAPGPARVLMAPEGMREG